MTEEEDSGAGEGPDAVEGRPVVPPCPACGETSWAVIYPVTLGVGVNGKGIERVVVEDENVGAILSVACRECSFQIRGEEARAHPAAQVAEQREWPAWDFGW